MLEVSVAVELVWRQLHSFLEHLGIVVCRDDGDGVTALRPKEKDVFLEEGSEGRISSRVSKESWCPAPLTPSHCLRSRCQPRKHEVPLDLVCGRGVSIGPSEPWQFQERVHHSAGGGPRQENDVSGTTAKAPAVRPWAT